MNGDMSVKAYIADSAQGSVRTLKRVKAGRMTVSEFNAQQGYIDVKPKAFNRDTMMSLIMERLAQNEQQLKEVTNDNVQAKLRLDDTTRKLEAVTNDGMQAKLRLDDTTRKLEELTHSHNELTHSHNEIKYNFTIRQHRADIRTWLYNRTEEFIRNNHPEWHKKLMEVYKDECVLHDDTGRFRIRNKQFPKWRRIVFKLNGERKTVDDICSIIFDADVHKIAERATTFAHDSARLNVFDDDELACRLKEVLKLLQQGDVSW
jgi:hypothetical protein